ncbi:MAG: hypothetical protein IPK74_04160 [Deltaproteobacteria bacterium]|nr:hypothetical protein [Deltaproteobacteria bacterium]
MADRSCLRWCVVLVLGGIACAPSVPSDETGGGSGSSDSGGSMGTTATTTASTTMTTAMTTLDTTGVPAGCAGDWVTGCQSYCAAIITCGIDAGPYEDCVTGCIAELAESTAECQVAQCDAFTCFGTLDCASLMNGNPDCEIAQQKADEVCGGGDESCYVGGGKTGTCEWGCSGPDYDHRVICDGPTCTCFDGDIFTAECPSDNVCDTFDALDAYAMACCGF